MKEVKLEENERIDDLQFNGLKIIQNKNLYCFTCDAVLLANFVKATYKDDILDLCSGSGVVGILALAKTNAKSLTCLEMQKVMSDMCQKTIEMNELTNKVRVVNARVQDAVKLLGNEKYSIIVCNPPYKKVNSHKINEAKEIAMSKYELELSFSELAIEVNKLLKYGGKFYFVNETNRLSEYFEVLRKLKLEPKRLQLIYPKKDANSHIALVECQKGAKTGLIVLPPVIL